MVDEMFFGADNKSLWRGKRRAARTPTCRPCMVWPKDAPEMAFQGVVIDMNPFGMCIRMLDAVPPATEVMVQLMRDEEFRVPMTVPVPGMVVRNTLADDGFVDHGILLQRAEDRRSEEQRPIRTEARRRPPTANKRGRSRMHTIDIIVGDRGIRRLER